MNQNIGTSIVPIHITPWKTPTPEQHWLGQVEEGWWILDFFFLNQDALLLIFSIIQDNIYKDSQWTWNIWTTIKKKKKERKSTWSLSHISKGSQYFGLLFLIYFSFNFNTCYFLIFIIFTVFNWFSS